MTEEKQAQVVTRGVPSGEDKQYPKGFELASIMLGLYLSVFLVALDRMIIATAIPILTNEFSSLGDIGWYGSGYLLTTCAFQLLFGRLYTFYNAKTVFISSIMIFEVGSAICGAAPSSTSFIIGRAIAGVGAGGIMAGQVVITVNSVPLAKRPMYIAFAGGIFGIASVAGPLLGGAFTTNVTWRWCFYINLPIGAVALLAIIFKLKITTAPVKAGLTLKEKLLQLDPLGNCLLLASVICLLLALQWGGSLYVWSDGRIIALLVLFGVLTIAFTALQVAKGDKASVPGSVAGQRSVAAALIITTCVYGPLMIVTYYLSIWFQAIKGVNAMDSGIRTIPTVLSLVVSGILSGIVTKRTGYYMPALIMCGLLLPIGSGMFLRFQPDTLQPAWIGYQVLFGLGIGFGLQQPTMAIQTVLPPPLIPTGTALVYFFQSLSGAIFVSVSQNVFILHLADGLQPIASIDIHSILHVGATELRGIVGADQLDEVLEVYNGALVKVFQVAVCVAACVVIGVLLMEWKSVKTGPKKALPKEETKEAPNL